MTKNHMTKNQAFLFYSHDFLTGTMFFSDEQVGKYIRALCAQHIHGHLSKSQIDSIVKGDSAVMDKFCVDADGKYYNNRMQIEVEKRTNYCNSRRNNKKNNTLDTKTYDKHMENTCQSYDKHMENININNNSEGEVGETTTTQPTWRDSFDVYKKIVDEAYQSILNDTTEIETQQRLNPHIDIKLSLEKAVHNFWGTDAGWQYKKKRRIKNLNMRQTLINAIDFNKVYTPQRREGVL